MGDREKVIKGLNELYDLFDTMDELEGLRDRVFDALDLLNELESERKAAMDAVKVLEDAARAREEGVKPIMQDAWPMPIYLCGKCGTGLWKRDDFKTQYCINCGRKVKWDADLQTQ